MAWEYKVIHLNSPVSDYSEKKADEVLAELEPLLNQAGSDGWELTSTFDTVALGYTKSVVAILKREKN